MNIHIQDVGISRNGIDSEDKMVGWASNFKEKSDFYDFDLLLLTSINWER